MTDGTTPAQAAPRRARWLVAVVALVAVLLLAFAIAWVERRSIARGYADDLLRQRGVPARYEIAELGVGRQRLTNVVLGDPARPDLVADWVETSTRLGWNGAGVTAIRAGRVRLRGRIVDGQVSLGTLDRLLPPPSGKPFALPSIDLAVQDGRLRLDTSAGPVGVKLSGQGGLQGGFAGTLAAVAPRLASGGCVLGDTSAYGRLSIGRGGAPRFAGPVRVAQGRCGTLGAAGLVAGLDLRLGTALDRWQGYVGLDLGAVRAPGLAAGPSEGVIRFAGTAQATQGTLGLDGDAVRYAGARLARWQLSGPWRIDTGRAATRSSFAGRVALAGLALPDLAARMRALRGTGVGTPLGPLAARLLPGLERGAAHSLTTASVRAALDTGGNWAARVTEAAIGLGIDGFAGRVTFAGGQGISLGPRGTTLDGTLTLSGGALPQGVVTLAQPAPGAPLTGAARFAPYAADGASLALAPLRFRATPGGNTLANTTATLSGPLGDGRVEGATLPLAIAWNGAERLVVNPNCAPARFAALRVAGLALQPAGFQLCPVGPALVTLDRGRLGGGARLGAMRLAGRLGSSPVAIAAAGSELRFTDAGLAVRGLALQLGATAQPTRLTVTDLSGRIAGGGIAGRFAGAGGRIGAVPLVMSEAAGDWRLANGVLTLGGGLTVSDAAPQRRFEPLPARDVALRFADGVIAATGTLTAPGTTIRVADVSLRHRLADGTGHADLAVPGVTFGPTLQPTALTPITLGVVADVRGTVAGAGRIDWTPAGVTSSGRFGTAELDLAAAFGPVTGLKGDIVFTDLLALQSAPAQVATVASINPGVAVEDGVVRYQLLPGPRVRIAGARWPFAGGTLSLEPALLDFSAPVERRLTFQVAGMDAALFLQRFDYKNLTATGVFDGNLPMVFDERGGRIEGGRLTARAGGGTLAYVGEVSQENLGTWGNLAFNALKALRYRELAITLNGPLAGEMVTQARFGGVAQGEGTRSNFLIRRLANLPFVFNVRIEAPFRALLDTARSFYDPNLLVQRNLPSLIEAEKARAGRPAVQPPASAPMPQQKQD